MESKFKKKPVLGALGIAFAAMLAAQPASAVTFAEGMGYGGADTGNSYATAQSVVNNTTVISGAIEVNDVDFYRFSWLGGDNGFDTDPLIATVFGGAEDTVLFLVDSNNVLLAYDDDINWPSNPASQIIVTGLAAGAYAIGVSNYSNFPTPLSIGSQITNWTNTGGSLGNQGGIYHIDFDSAVGAVPEPETYAMLLAGLGLMGFVARRRQRKLAAA